MELPGGLHRTTLDQRARGTVIRYTLLRIALLVPTLLGVLAVTRFEWFVLLVLAVRPSLDILGVGGLGPGAMLATVFVATAALWLIVQYRSGHWQPMSLAAKCLVAFGGAGGLHAAALAGALGMRRILVPRDDLARARRVVGNAKLTLE